MVASNCSRFFLLAFVFGLCSARTDLSGCVSSTAGASLIWYVPGTGETCEFLDCGGGRAPPKTTVPGCAAYSGTATYSPSYLPGYGPTSSVSSTAAASGTLESTVPTSSMVVTSMTVSSSAADASSTLTTTSDSYYFSSSSTSMVHSTASVISSVAESPSKSSAAASAIPSTTTKSSSAAASASNVVSAGTLLKLSNGSLGVVGLIAAILG